MPARFRCRPRFASETVCFTEVGSNSTINLGSPVGGLAVIDHDKDGFPDLIIGNKVGNPNRLYRNVPDPARPGNRTFIDATTGSGLDDVDGQNRISMGVLVADIDNDGRRDVFMLGETPYAASTGLLYRQDSSGKFVNVSTGSGLRSSVYCSESAGFADYDLDGLVDLIVVSWNTAPTNIRLFRNLGNARFQDVSNPAAADADLPASGTRCSGWTTTTTATPTASSPRTRGMCCCTTSATAGAGASS